MDFQPDITEGIQIDFEKEMAPDGLQEAEGVTVATDDTAAPSVLLPKSTRQELTIVIVLLLLIAM